MADIFMELFNMSLTAAPLILAVVLLRKIFSGAPKYLRCIMWGVVALRLILPFSVESALSLIPTERPVDTELFDARPYVETGIGAADNRINGYLGDRYFEGVTVAEGAARNFLTVCACIWLAGTAAMLLYAFISYGRLRKRVGASILTEKNIYICDGIDSPFILGLFRPRIYIPSHINGEQAEYIAAHENAHIRRRDHWWKPLGFAILSVYWFNPLVWAAYILLCRDIELACDERVVRELDFDSKKAYSQALLECSVNGRAVTACPLAFGETGVRERVKNALSYKKPAFWLIAAAAVACAAVTVFFATDPKGARLTERLSGSPGISVDNAISAEIERDGEIHSVNGKAALDNMLDYIENIRVDRREVSENMQAYENWTKCITLYYDNSFCKIYFNDDFTMLQLDNGVKPSYVYRIKKPDYASALFEQHGSIALGNDYALENKKWIFCSAQSREKNGAVVYCGESFAEAYPEARVLSLELTADSSELTLRDASTGKKWAMSYTVESDTQGGRIFKLTGKGFDMGEAYANIGITSYYGGEAEYTMFISSSGYSLCFVCNYGVDECGLTQIDYEHYDTYVFENSILGNSVIGISKTDDSFVFSYSVLSSELITGTYALNKQELVLTQNNDNKGTKQYFFTVNNKSLIFDAERSAKIPSYRSSANGEFTEAVPDGAEFKASE